MKYEKEIIKVKKEIPNLSFPSSSSSFPREDNKVKKEIPNLSCPSFSSSFPQEDIKVKKEIPNLRCASSSSSFPQEDIKVKKEIPNLRCPSSSSSFPQEDNKVKKEIPNLKCPSSSSSFPQEDNKVKKEIPNLRCPSHSHLKATPSPLSADFCERCDLIDFYYHNVLKGSDDDDSLDYFVSYTLRHCEFGSAADSGAGSKEASPPPPPQTPLQGSESAPADITGEEVSEEPMGGSPESGRGARGGGLTYFFFCIADTATATAAIGVMGSFEEADAPEEIENGGEGG